MFLAVRAWWSSPGARGPAKAPRENDGYSKTMENLWENIHFQLLQLMPELQAPEGLQLGTSDSSENLLEIIGDPCVSCSPDLPGHYPDLDHCE